MAEKIEGVYEIKIVQGPALRAFEGIKKRLDDTKGAIRDMNKETRHLVAEEQAINKAIAQTGQATAEQTAALARNKAQREGLNKTLSEAVLTERALSAQARELSNNLSGLTEHGLRFRDKMAEATTIALQQSGIIGELAKRHEQLSGAMQKVDAAMEGNAAQTQALNAALAKGEVTQQQYADEQARLASELTDAKAAQKLLADELDRSERQVKELDMQVSNLNKELAEGRITSKQYRESLRSIEENAKRSADSTARLGSKFDEFVASQKGELGSSLRSMALQYIGVQAAINGVVSIIGGAARTIADFDAQMSRISALGGEYAASINELSKAARSIGPAFNVGPTEAAKSIEALAKAGVSAADITGGALKGALALAAAGTLDAGQAAEYAASTMVQFGLAGEDMSHVADLLAAAANKAQGDVSDFGNALKFIGPVAAGAGVSLEEVTGTLALFANNGILGEQAGTSLRGVLLSLTSPSALASKTMIELGIATEDGASKLYDAQGNFLGLANMAGVLKEATAGLTQAERDQALGRIFGNQQITAANILLKEGKGAVEEWTGAVNDGGIAMRIAAEQTDNLKGASDRLGVAWDNLILSFEDGDGVIGKTSKAMLDMLSSWLNLLSGIEGSTDSFGSKMLRFGAVFTPFGAAMETGRQGAEKFAEEARKAEQAVEALGKASITSYEQGLKKFGASGIELGVVRDRVRAINEEIEAAGKSPKVLGELLQRQIDKVKGLQQGTLAWSAANADMEQIMKRLAVVQKEAGDAATDASAKAVEGSAKQAASVETVGQKLERLKVDLKAAQDARAALSATDTAGIATVDKTIAALNRQIAALQGTERAAKTSSDAAKERQQVLEDITKAEANRARANDTPEQKEVTQATATRDDRVKKAKGDADLLLKIEKEYQASLTEIQTRYAAERFAQRQQAEDDAAKFLSDKRTAAAQTELDALKQRQDQELVLAAQGGDDLTALMERQQAEREALVQTLRDAEVQKINDTYEAQYAALDAAGASTLELQAQHAADLNALNEQFRLEDEANAQAAGQRRLQILQQQQAIELEAAKDLGNALGELASGQLKDQKDLEKALLKILLKSVKAQIQMAIVAATAKEVGTKGFIGLGTAALLTGLLEGLFAGLGNVIEGFATGGTVPQHRGTVTSAWGRPVRRANGDNVLVTLKSGEKVLNEDQQKRLEAIAGKSIWGAIKLPGHSMTDAMRRMRHGNLIAGYAEGGTVGIVTPRPAPQTVVQNQFVQSMAAYSDRPMFVSVREINDVQGRVTVTENLGSL